MNKKLSSLICVALIVIISIPIISIAFAGKPDRGPLEKIVFIHYKKGYGKPEGTPGKPPKVGEGDYKLLVKGAKWKTTEPIVIDPDNPDGLSEAFIVSAITASVNEWDDGTYSDWGGVPIDLFGGHSTVHDATFDTVTPDGRNEILFGDYQQEGVIAVCIVWGYFGGRPSGREIIEFDIMFDTDFDWGDATVNPEVMDLQNIATHELGHGAGLGDLYRPRTSEETMYGYSEYGETKKRTLESGDIAGIQFLYGE